jgi:hypothetical protein
MSSRVRCAACGASLEQSFDAHAAVGRKAKCRACRADARADEEEEEGGTPGVDIARMPAQLVGGHTGAPAAVRNGEEEAARAASCTMRCALWDEDRRTRPAWRGRLHRQSPAALEEPVDSVFAASVGSLKHVTGRVGKKRVVRFFVSSTFTDTFFERNWLLEGGRVGVWACAACGSLASLS